MVSGLENSANKEPQSLRIAALASSVGIGVDSGRGEGGLPTKGNQLQKFRAAKKYSCSRVVKVANEWKWQGSMNW
jgi:hypothetical protein